MKGQLRKKAGISEKGYRRTGEAVRDGNVKTVADDREDYGAKAGESEERKSKPKMLGSHK